jgi:succinate-acetate transporter protein
MENTVLFLLAGFTGILTADLFIRSWTGFLKTTAIVMFFARGRLTLQVFLGRLNTSVAVLILCFLTLILCFFLYSIKYGLGRSEAEQLAYFFGAVTRTAMFLKDASGIIEGMFDEEGEL